MRRYLFARKVYYLRDGDMGTTPCPFGGSIENGLFFKHGILWEGAKVGSLACSNCLFNRGTEVDFVRCVKKPDLLRFPVSLDLTIPKGV